MTLEEAIKIVDKWREPCSYDDAEKLHQAAQLLIEAGKRVLNSRVEPTYSSVDPLPGETKD